MQIVDLDGNEIKWRALGKEVTHDYRPRSKLHKDARIIIKDRFSTLMVLEEVPVPIRRGKTLYLDFYLPLRKIAVEVHGEQHYKFNTMYHSSRGDFLKQKKNDREKEEWCEINGIDLIVFPYNSQDSWGELI